MKLHAPATARNREFIASVLSDVLPDTGNVLEVASGSGEHVAFFAERLVGLSFQPSDIDERARQSIDAHVSLAALANVSPAISIDATAPDSWPAGPFDALLNINMIHISPWEACVGLFDGASRVIAPNGVIYLYGPFIRAEVATAPSNLSFDRSLRQRNPAWGVRDLSEVTRVGESRGFVLERIEPMPANNLSVLFRRSPT